MTFRPGHMKVMASLYLPHNKVVGGGVYWFHSVRPFVRPSVRLSVAEDIPPPVFNQLFIKYLVHLLVRIKEPSSPTGWQQSPQPQREDTKMSWKLDYITTGFIHDDAVNFTVDVHPSRIPCPLCSTCSSGWIHFIFIHLIKQLQRGPLNKVLCKIS